MVICAHGFDLERKANRKEKSELNDSEKLVVGSEDPMTWSAGSLQHADSLQQPTRSTESTIKDIDLTEPVPDSTLHTAEQIFAAADQAVDEVARREDENIGKVLGGVYRIQAPLGAGGMSVVYKAEHLLLQRIVVIKFIAHERTADAKAVMRFAQEAKAAAMLSHPNVVATREFGVAEDGRPYIVMDYVDGIPLSTLIEKQSPLRPERAIELVLQMCEGLGHSHEKGIVHRDIKPANIIIESEGGERETVKIVDFGIAKNTMQPGQALTQTGEVFGSPLYMSPEQCRGQSVGAQSDIYSLGCVLAEMLTGNPPYQGNSAFETILLHMTGEPPEFTNLPPDLENIVLKALERDTSKRYQTIADLQRALESANLGGGRRAKRRNRRFFTRTRVIAYCSIAAVSTLGAILAAVLWTNQHTQWRDTLAAGEKAALQGNTALAERLFDTALVQAKKSETWSTAQVDIHQVKGDMYEGEYEKKHFQNDYNKAWQEYRITYGAAMDGGNEFQKAHITEKLGDIYHDGKDFANAEQRYDEALQHRIKDAGKDSYFAALTEHRRGVNYKDEGKHKQAEQALLHALKIYRMFNDDDRKSLAIRTLIELATNAALTNDKKKAVAYLNQAIEQAKMVSYIGDDYVQKMIQARAALQKADNSWQPSLGDL
jgi:tRNA A-37 threonylcarbamoyl transferase component Bud32/tetratricopeptide (TPR) repeat protein